MWGLSVHDTIARHRQSDASVHPIGNGFQGPNRLWPVDPRPVSAGDQSVRDARFRGGDDHAAAAISCMTSWAIPGAISARAITVKPSTRAVGPPPGIVPLSLEGVEAVGQARGLMAFGRTPNQLVIFQARKILGSGRSVEFPRPYSHRRCCWHRLTR